MVIDVKNDNGQVTYASDIEIVREVGANTRPPIQDIEAVMDKLREKDVYPIARLVVFRDPHLPEQRPDWAILQKGGGGICGTISVLAGSTRMRRMSGIIISR